MEAENARYMIRERLQVLQNETGTLFVPMWDQLIKDLEQQAWQRGVDFANDIADRERQENMELLTQVVTRMGGKDRADGIIKLSVYPDPEIYDWHPAIDRG